MCYEVTCKKCGKATWKGCGQHVDQVMRGIPKSQRCQGHAAEPSGGFFAGLFSRWAALAASRQGEEELLELVGGDRIALGIDEAVAHRGDDDRVACPVERLRHSGELDHDVAALRP